MSEKLEIPATHFWHLKRFANARGESISESASFLLTNGARKKKNWISTSRKYNKPGKDELKKVPIESSVSASAEELMLRIQALPQRIRGALDGPIGVPLEFDVSSDGIQKVKIGEHTFLDPAPPGNRDITMYKMVQDKLDKDMSIDEYRIMSRVNSQYLRLKRNTHKYTMPSEGQIAVDAGCYIGYKAFAMADLVGPSGKVIAIEAEKSNFDILRRNVEDNGMSERIIPMHCALDSEEIEKQLFTRKEGTMANSLVSFDTFKVRKTTTVQTRTLESVFKEVGVDHIDNIHVSVNGYERQVLDGLGSFVDKVNLFRVTCPFEIEGKSVREAVNEYFKSNNIPIAGKWGGAIVAGKDSDRYIVE